jgi:hypothetical protein
VLSELQFDEYNDQELQQESKVIIAGKENYNDRQVIIAHHLIKPLKV